MPANHPNPEAYRPKAESDAWPLGDPVERLKLHLIRRGLWSEERHVQAVAEVRDTVVSAQKAAEKNGTLHSGPSPRRRSIFDGLYAETPLHLKRQRAAAEKWL